MMPEKIIALQQAARQLFFEKKKARINYDPGFS